MELLTHDMTALFAQLGLANDETSLHRFIRDHPRTIRPCCPRPRSGPLPRRASCAMRSGMTQTGRKPSTSWT